MKHAIDESGVLQSNLLQAFQKNKLIQGKLNERHQSYYVQFMKDMQEYDLQAKLNNELLYNWKKENYVRQLKKNIQEYEKKRFGARDAYYEYQARSLDFVLTGQKGLIIPPKEEERRSHVNTKYNQFLQDNPLRTKTPTRVVQSAKPTIDQIRQHTDEDNTRGVEETWKHIHAQSAYGLKRKKRKILPSMQRSLTMDEIILNKHLPINPIPPTVITVPTVPVATLLEIVNGSSEGKGQPVLPARSTVAEDMAPIMISSQALDKETRADLVAMRSVRRPQKNPIDLNITFEARRRLYQMNKRVYDYQLCQRKCGLQYNSQFDRPQQIDPADDEQNLLVEMSEITRRRYEDRHQADKNFI